MPNTPSSGSTTTTVPTNSTSGATTFEIEFTGLAPLYRAWRAALPPEKRADW